ncbi:MAG: transcription termination factor Rho [Opitutaceae bacterium]|nr:transcription termination factor Rho [Opitutaceae bacterium]
MADQENAGGEDAAKESTPKKKTVKRARTRTAKSAAKPAKATEVQTTFESEPAAEKPAAAPKQKNEQSDAPEPRAAPAESRPDADDDIPAYESDGDGGDYSSGGREGGQGGNRNGPPRGKKGRGKKNKWKKRDPRDRPPPQPLPPGMEEVKLGELPDAALFEDIAALDEEAAASHKSSKDPIRLHEMYPLGIAELGAQGEALGATIEGVPSRRAWLEAIYRVAADKDLPITDHGWLDMTDDGYGFVVHSHVAYRLYPENSYVPASLVKRYGLKRGHEVKVTVRAPKEGERCPAVVGIDSVMDREPESIGAIKPFEELEPYYPLQRILMEAPVHKDISMRAVDLLTPIGFGQRGLIVAPPRTGKTVLMQNMANSVSHNFPDSKLILLLIDERPEEVTDFKRHTKGEVVSSTFDEAPTNHVHAAEMVIEKARRLVELGEHVVILLDSITRLARAYNALAGNSGKIMSGGIEATALQKPKRFFGSARNIEGGGSLTILGTALIDTNSRMDEVIF